MELFLYKRKPPWMPPRNELSEGADMANCQFPASCAPLGCEVELFPPHDANISRILNTRGHKEFASFRRAFVNSNRMFTSKAPLQTELYGSRTMGIERV